MAAVSALISKYRTRSGPRYRVRITNRRLRAEAASFNRAGFKTRREAEEYARSVRDKVARLERGDVELGRTVSELIERYQEEALPHLNPVDQRVRKQQLAWWRNSLGDKTSIADVSPRVITDNLRQLSLKPRESAPRGKLQAPKALPRPISAATINRYRAALSAVFTFAVKDIHWSDRNPVRDTRISSEPSGRVRWLEPHELERLGRAVDAQSASLTSFAWVRVHIRLGFGNAG